MKRAALKPSPSRGPVKGNQPVKSNQKTMSAHPNQKSPTKKTTGKGAPPEEEYDIKNIPENKKLWYKHEKMISLAGRFDDIDGLSNIVRTALKGVSPDVFYAFATLIDMPDRYLAELLNTSARTLSNYKEQNKTLEPVKGEHLLKLISLFKKGEAVFGKLHEFHGWLFKPQLHAEEVPIDWLVTPGGVDLVSQELDRIAHGYAL